MSLETGIMDMVSGPTGTQIILVLVGLVVIVIAVAILDGSRTNQGRSQGKWDRIRGVWRRKK